MKTALLRKRRGGSAVARYAANGLRPDLVITPTLQAVNGAPGSAFTHSRASGATYLDSTGTLQTAASGVLRDNAYAYVDGVLTGPYIQLESAAATNLLHNTDALVTQTEAVTAQPYTLHFTGTGTVTLLGASTAGPLVGTGAGENNRVSLTFTPTAGILTLTVSGTVTNAQLEAGSIPTSYIPNLAASGSVSRAAETLTIPNPPWPATVEVQTNVSDDFSGYADQTAAESAGYVFTSCSFDAVNNQVDFSGVAANVRIDGAFDTATTNGSLYEVTFTVSNYVSGSLAFQDAFSTVGTQVTANGSFTRIFAKSAISANIRFNTSDFTGSIDNVSVKEIAPRGLAIAMDGLMTYADTGAIFEGVFFGWNGVDTTNSIFASLDTGSVNVGRIQFRQYSQSVLDLVVTGPEIYSPGINVPFSIASRHGDNFINGAVDGTALTANLTPTILPALSSTPIQIGSTFNGFIDTLRIWDVDIGDTGIEEAST